MDRTPITKKGLENWAEGSVLKLSPAPKVWQHMTPRQEEKAQDSLGKHLRHWPDTGQTFRDELRVYARPKKGRWAPGTTGDCPLRAAEGWAQETMARISHTES